MTFDDIDQSKPVASGKNLVYLEKSLEGYTNIIVYDSDTGTKETVPFVGADHVVSEDGFSIFQDNLLYNDETENALKVYNISSQYITHTIPKAHLVKAQMDIGEERVLWMADVLSDRPNYRQQPNQYGLFSYDLLNLRKVRLTRLYNDLSAKTDVDQSHPLIHDDLVLYADDNKGVVLHDMFVDTDTVIFPAPENTADYCVPKNLSDKYALFTVGHECDTCTVDLYLYNILQETSTLITTYSPTQEELLEPSLYGETVLWLHRDNTNTTKLVRHSIDTEEVAYFPLLINMPVDFDDPYFDVEGKQFFFTNSALSADGGADKEIFKFVLSAFMPDPPEPEPEDDTEQPNITILQPAAGDTFTRKDEIKIIVDVSDNVGVDHVTIMAAHSIGVTDTESPYELLWDTKKFKPGEYPISVKAYDLSGNVNSQTIYVTLEKKPKNDRWKNKKGHFKHKKAYLKHLKYLKKRKHHFAKRR